MHVDAYVLQWKPDTPFTLDVIDFERAAERTTSSSDFQQAIDLYHGDSLPGCYDDWILPKREQLHQLFIETLVRLIQVRTLPLQFVHEDMCRSST